MFFLRWETCAFVAQKSASLGSIKTSEVWLLRKEASFLHKRNDICWHSMTAALWSNNISTHKIKTEPYFSFQTATVVLLHFRCGQRRAESKNNHQTTQPPPHDWISFWPHVYTFATIKMFQFKSIKTSIQLICILFMKYEHFPDYKQFGRSINLHLQRK